MIGEPNDDGFPIAAGEFVSPSFCAIPPAPTSTVTAVPVPVTGVVPYLRPPPPPPEPPVAQGELVGVALPPPPPPPTTR